MVEAGRILQSTQDSGARQVYVMPGEVRASAEPVRFLTILGSCVAICLHDPVTGIGGINHFLLPGEAPASNRDPLRWGRESIDRLFAEVMALGVDMRSLQAKLFGGAQITQRHVAGSFRIGERNVEYALAELGRRGITVVSRSVGGEAGRKIMFDSSSGVVWVKELRRESG